MSQHCHSCLRLWDPELDDTNRWKVCECCRPVWNACPREECGKILSLHERMGRKIIVLDDKKRRIKGLEDKYPEIFLKSKRRRIL